jgi:hypothetical protein
LTQETAIFSKEVKKQQQKSQNHTSQNHNDYIYKKWIQPQYVLGPCSFNLWTERDPRYRNRKEKPAQCIVDKRQVTSDIVGERQVHCTPPATLVSASEILAPQSGTTPEHNTSNFSSELRVTNLDMRNELRPLQ